MNRFCLLQLFLQLGLTLIPLKPCSKQFLVRLGHGWNPIREEFEYWFANPIVNIGLRCGKYITSLEVTR